MLQNIRRRVAARLAGEESGFTLIELLVVMLILGILAAIALPAFFNQKDKAGDAKAKEILHTAQVAMETCNTDNGGKYSETACTTTQLNEIEPTIPATMPTEPKAGEYIELEPEDEDYVLKAEGNSGWFEIKNTGGELAFNCESENEGGCGAEGKWGN